MNDLVSIIMPSYNTAKFISFAINSVLSQTYSNWELIIVDDCSTDDTDTVVLQFNDSRIHYIKNEINCGTAISRNKALRKASGKWIAFLDSDDIWMPDKLEKQIRFMEDNDYHFSYTKYREIDENNTELNRIWSGPKKIKKALMYTFNYMGCLTVMYDSNYVGLVQIENIPKRNDYAIWIKVSRKCTAYLLDKVLAAYRIRTAGSIMDRKKGTLYRLKYNYYLWKNGERINTFFSIVLTIVNLFFGSYKKLRYKSMNKQMG